MHNGKPRFSLGRLLCTPGAIVALEESRQSAMEFLARHAAGDWGDLCDEDKKLNDQAALDGGRLFSAYTLKTGTKIWVITASDRSSTCTLSPSEY